MENCQICGNKLPVGRTTLCGRDKCRKASNNLKTQKSRDKKQRKKLEPELSRKPCETTKCKNSLSTDSKARFCDNCQIEKQRERVRANQQRQPEVYNARQREYYKLRQEKNALSFEIDDVTDYLGQTSIGSHEPIIATAHGASGTNFDSILPTILMLICFIDALAPEPSWQTVVPQDSTSLSSSYTYASQDTSTLQPSDFQTSLFI